MHEMFLLAHMCVGPRLVRVPMVCPLFFLFLRFLVLSLSFIFIFLPAPPRSGLGGVGVGRNCRGAESRACEHRGDVVGGPRQSGAHGRHCPVQPAAGRRRDPAQCEEDDGEAKHFSSFSSSSLFLILGMFLTALHHPARAVQCTLGIGCRLVLAIRWGDVCRRANSSRR